MDPYNRAAHRRRVASLALTLTAVTSVGLVAPPHDADDRAARAPTPRHATGDADVTPAQHVRRLADAFVHRLSVGDVDAAAGLLLMPSDDALAQRVTRGCADAAAALRVAEQPPRFDTTHADGHWAGIVWHQPGAGTRPERDPERGRWLAYNPAPHDADDPAYAWRLLPDETVLADAAIAPLCNAEHDRVVRWLDHVDAPA